MLKKIILSNCLLACFTSVVQADEIKGHWEVGGLVFKYGTSTDYINKVEKFLNQQAAVLKESDEYKKLPSTPKLYNFYYAAGYTFLVGPIFSNSSHTNNKLTYKYSNVRMLEQLGPGKEEMDMNIESILLAHSDTNPHPSEANINSFWEYGITGTNYKVGILDSGIDIEHRAFVNKNVTVLGSNEGSIGEDYNWRLRNEWLKTEGSRHLRSAHGTAVAGAMAGNTEFYNGIAKDADIIFSYAGSASDTLIPAGNTKLAKLIRELKSANVTMSSLQYIAKKPIASLNYSFGNGRILAPTEGTLINKQQDWSFWARYFDAVSYENDFLFVKSAGNYGSKDSNGDPSDIQPYSLSSPADNFNGLTVANVDTTVDGTIDKTTDRGLHKIRSTSSRGPTTLGRRKPDISAPGHNTRTAAPDPYKDYKGPYKDKFTIEKYKEYDEYSITRLAGGTSLASPEVAGAAVLVRQALEKSEVPPGTKLTPLVKSVLLNSADNSSSHVLYEDLPSYCESNGNWCPSRGWGYMDMTQAYAEYAHAIQFPLLQKNPMQAFKFKGQYNYIKATAVWEHNKFDDAAALFPVKVTLFVNGKEKQSDSSLGMNNVLQVQGSTNNNACIEVVSEQVQFTGEHAISLASNVELEKVTSCSDSYD